MKKLLSLSALLLLTACGFTPLYGNVGGDAIGTEDYLSYVAIDNIPDREGVYLRNALIDRFHRNGAPIRNAYLLNIREITEDKRGLDITKSSDATRGQLIISANVELRDNINGEIVFRRNLQSVTSYNILSSEFATRISEDNTRMNALDNLAEQIELQLTLYFKTR